MTETGVACCVDNIVKHGMGPAKWDFLYQYCRKMPKSIRILDVGCGLGNCMLFLLERGYKNLVGVEYDEDVYLPAVARYPELNIIKGNAEDLDGFEDDCFDLVYCCHVLEHLPNPKLAVGEAKRVLKKGGAYIVGVPNGDHLNDKVMRIVQRLVYGRSDHLQSFNLRKISNLLEKNGFEIVKTEFHYGSLELLLDRRIGEKLPSFFPKIVYEIIKEMYWREVGFDILAIKK